MKVINLTPHGISVFNESDFLNLEQVNPTTLYADGVRAGAWEAFYPSEGVARISTEVGSISIPGVPGLVVKTTYGEATGIPTEVGPEDILIVSLPMQSMAAASGHPLAAQMAAPYKVVRNRNNTSEVLGCMGFTFQ